MTNFEALKDLNIEELAKFLDGTQEAQAKSGGAVFANNVNWWKDWLNEEDNYFMR